MKERKEKKPFRLSFDFQYQPVQIDMFVCILDIFLYRRDLETFLCLGPIDFHLHIIFDI